MTLRIGVIGAGIMGADHIRTISAEISGAEVRAIADIDENRAKIIASQVECMSLPELYRECRGRASIPF